MKTKLALALAACALNAQAININITHHDFERVSFTLTDIDVQGFTSLRDTYGILAHESIFGISANSRSDGIVQVSINWVHPTHPFEDTFRIGNGIVPTTDFDGDSYQQLGHRLWEWNYVRPPVVADGGSMLAGLGVALLGLWRIRR
jgi:hypothetical protein